MIFLPIMSSSKCSPHRSCPKTLPYDLNQDSWSPGPGSLGNICTFGPSKGSFLRSPRLFRLLCNAIFLIHLPEGTSESTLGYSSPRPIVILKCEWNRGSEVTILSHLLISLPEHSLALLNLSTYQSVMPCCYLFFLVVYATLLKQNKSPAELLIDLSLATCTMNSVLG